MNTEKLNNPAQKLAALRTLMHDEKLDAFFIPRSDPYQGEHVAPHYDRLHWLTGFGGSSGLAIITQDRAVVMSDSRYDLELKTVVPPHLYEIANIIQMPPSHWLNTHIAQGARIGYDPLIHTIKDIEELQSKLSPEIELYAVDNNLVDMIWHNQPKLEETPVELFPLHLAGKSAQEKINELSKNLRERHVFAALISIPDSIAWLLNIRARDVPHCPFALSRAIIYQDSTLDWFINAHRLTPHIRSQIGSQVRIMKPDTLEGRLAELGVQASQADQKISLDKGQTSMWFLNQLKKADASLVFARDPCYLGKACKTPSEQEAIRQTHIHEARALAQFEQWLATQSFDRQLSEYEIQTKLQEFRSLQPGYQEDSFKAIVGFQGNGAKIHYEIKKQSAASITSPGLLLVDSGGQYLSQDFAGTTDVTRTYAIGTPDLEQKKYYTLVLKAHIAVASIRIPYGVRGVQVDAIARQVLWNEDLDFGHGVGHGVGCYLSVHQDAARLSPLGDDKIEPGMVLSNEPGLYFEGKYGIRLENLMLVQKSEQQDTMGRDMLFFETLTLLPFEDRLIEDSYLTQQERNWLSQYHQRIHTILQ